MTSLIGLWVIGWLFTISLVFDRISGLIGIARMAYAWMLWPVLLGVYLRHKDDFLKATGQLPLKTQKDPK